VVAIDADARVWQWDLAALRGGIIAIHDGWVWSIASDDQITASASEAGTAIVVDRRTGVTRLGAQLASDIYKIVLDGERLVVGGDDGLHMWRWSDGAALPLAEGRGIRIWDVEPATAGDGSRVYLAGALRAAEIYLWRDTSRHLLYRVKEPNVRVNDLAVAPGGRHAAAVTSLGTLVLIDVAAQRVTAAIAAHPLTWCRKVVFDPTTASIVTIGDDGYLRTWSASDGAPRRQLRVSAGALYGLDVQAGRAAIAAADGSVVLVDVATGQIVQRFRGHDTAALTVQLRADGRWLVSGDEAGRACLWRVDASECHTWLDGHTQGVIAARFADDGTIFTSSKEGLVRFWRPTYDAPLEALRTELAGHGSR
jgi:WD40 repeat protein